MFVQGNIDSNITVVILIQVKAIYRTERALMTTGHRVLLRLEAFSAVNNVSPGGQCVKSDSLFRGTGLKNTAFNCCIEI